LSLRNITNLIRNTTAYDEASPVPNYKAAHLDSLIFTYNFGNQLKKVNDRSSNQAGFKNTGSSTDDFAYNRAGAITQDKNKGIDSVKYNAFGLIERVKFSSGKSIQYYYDANGSKLSMKMVDGNQTQHTKYVGEFIYRNDTLEFISSPEGRLVQKSNAFKYEYFITDHMGNNRLLFKSDAATENTYTANFETSTNNEFTNYNNRVGFNLMDKTDAGTTYTFSQKLTGGFNAQVGLSKSLKVYPGDKIEIQAFAKYLSSSQTTNLAGFASALTQAFGLSATSTGEAAKAFQSINEYGGFIATGNGEGNSTHPKAFINILVYDKDFNFLDLAFDQVQGGEQIPNGANTPHDELNINYEVKKEGYIFFFISYEDSRSFEVYFDDVSIKHKETRIIQYNEYYAHGMLNANSWTRTANSNKNLFNAGTELNATTNWYDTPLRGLDPVLGRFMQLDALAELSPSLTPYRFGFNNPMSFNDPTGAYENNYGLIGDVGNYVGRGYDKDGDAGLARYFGNYNEERMIRSEVMNVGGGGTSMSVAEFLVEMWTGKNKGGSWKNGKGKIYDNVKDAKNNFRDNLGIDVWAAERKQRKARVIVEEIIMGEELNKFDKQQQKQDRPWDLDGNGKFSLEEANNWFRNGKGETVQVNLNSIDFSNVYKSDITKNNGYVNLFFKQSPASKFFSGGGNVYGTIKLEIVSGFTVRAPGGYFDKYDFDIKPWNADPQRILRNTATHIGAAVAGEGTPFKIEFLGTATLAGDKPYPPR
jgi:RHS repeat-associated protein